MSKIKRRYFIKTLGIAGMVSFGMGSNIFFGKGVKMDNFTQKPNIIFLLTDDQRWDALGCAGNSIIHTPNMDKMAKNGIRFTNAFVTTSICAASRASIFTGVVERTHGYTFGTPPVPEQYAENSYSLLLRSAGYRTGFVGKYGVQMDIDVSQLFDSFVKLGRNPYFKKQPDGTVKHLTDITGDKAIEFLRSCSTDQPFCLSVSFNAPHAEDSDSRQYIWPKSVDHLYKDVKIPEPKLSESEFFSKQPEFLRESLNRVRWKWRFDTPEKYQQMVKGYYRMVSGVDVVIGRIMEELERLEFDKSTVIFLMGDNGYFLGERGYAGKWVPYEESLKVPLIMYDPRSDDVADGKASQMVLNIDIAPTILELAGVSIPKTIQGHSLVPILKGQTKEWREEFFFEHLYDHSKIPKCEGIRTERYKYIRYFEQKPVYEEMYDLENDLLETQNLVNDSKYVGILNQLRNRCNELRKIYKKRKFVDEQGVTESTSLR